MPKRSSSSNATRAAKPPSENRNNTQHFFGRLAPHKKIAGDAHQRHEREILIHGGDSVIHRVARRIEFDRNAVDENLPRRRLVHAGQYLDESRFAGAVVAEQTASDAAGIDLKRDIFQRDDRAEILADIAEFDKRRHFEVVRPAADEVVKQNGDDKHQPQKNLKPIGVDIRVINALENDAENQRPDSPLQ